MNKLNRKDYIYIGLTILIVLEIFLLITRGVYLFGSSLDWESQHSVLPDYFRTLFYDSKSIFPSFAFNIGNGQNIYNLAYYGLFNPVFCIAYILPFIPMTLYVPIVAIASIIASIILMYKFLLKKGYSSEATFISTLCLALSTSLTFHAHRHIMFMTYMPFLLMGLFGVDKKIESNKSYLLIISVFLIVMTSYYYSITSLLVIGLYSIYRYLSINKKFDIKKFIVFLISIGIPMLIGILMSCILIVPSFFAILNSRESTTTFVNLKDLLIPKMDLTGVVISYYGIGLSPIVIPALVSFLNKKKENRFLFISLLVIILFPIINYVLNATMYIDCKILIPFLPLYILVISEFINNVFKHKIKIKDVFIYSFISLLIFMINYPELILQSLIIFIALFLYLITILISKKNINYFTIVVFLFSFGICLISNLNDTLVIKDFYYKNYDNVKDMINVITSEDKSFYRINNQIGKKTTPNEIYGNIDYYSSTIYSSLSNQKYNNFYYDGINNNIPNRNRALLSASSNILSMMHSNNKYLILDKKQYQGYEEVYANKNVHVYKNEDILPIGYSTSNIMSIKDFNSLSFADKQEALLKYIVVGNNTSKEFNTNIKKINLNIDEELKKQGIKIDEGHYLLKVKSEKKMIKLSLDDQYKDKILFIKFKMNSTQECTIGDQRISINGVVNKLTCSDWKYYNDNREFTYTLSFKDINTIRISVSKGIYDISDIEAYYLDYNDIKDVNKEVSPFIIDREKTKGDFIYGSIDSKEDGYFILTVPYDKGFNIKLDNKEIEYELVDNAYIGFKIDKGNHNIEIEYRSPGRLLGMSMSIIGILSLIGISIYERKK